LERLGFVEPKADTRPSQHENGINYGTTAAEARLDHISAEVERRIVHADLEAEEAKRRVVSYDQLFRGGR
jgi:hypothetical protein